MAGFQLGASEVQVQRPNHSATLLACVQQPLLR